MINASTAYDRTIRNIQNNTTEEMEKVSKEISNAIQKGKFRITLNKLSNESQKQIESLGYKVESGSQYNEWYYVISWGDNI
nr:hypothetical protein [uncultured Lachnoclostridium sp.]